MGVRDEIAARIDYLRTEWEELSTLRHGCTCGKSSVPLTTDEGEDHIDGLDQCCQGHDAAYGAVGVEGGLPMFTPDAFMKTVEADRALAECAASSDGWTDATHPLSHPDPEGFRQRLIDFFLFRAWVGEQLRAAQAAGEYLGLTDLVIWDWVAEVPSAVSDGVAGAWDDAATAVDTAVNGFKEWLLWAAEQIEHNRPDLPVDDVRTGYIEHASYLESLGVDRSEIDAIARDAGVAPEQVAV